MTLHTFLIIIALWLSANIAFFVNLVLRMPKRRRELPDYLRRAL